MGSAPQTTDRLGYQPREPRPALATTIVTPPALQRLLSGKGAQLETIIMLRKNDRWWELCLLVGHQGNGDPDQASMLKMLYNDDAS